MAVEPITTALRIAGVPLNFTGFAIQAVPRFEVFSQSFDNKTSYEINPQEFAFDTSTALVKEHSLVSGQQFTVSDGTYSYQFEITDIVPDLIGWSIISANYRSKSPV